MARVRRRLDDDRESLAPIRGYDAQHPRLPEPGAAPAAGQPARRARPPSTPPSTWRGSDWSAASRIAASRWPASPTCSTRWRQGRRIEQVLGIESAIVEAEEDESAARRRGRARGRSCRTAPTRRRRSSACVAVGLLDRHERASTASATRASSSSASRRSQAGIPDGGAARRVRAAARRPARGGAALRRALRRPRARPFIEAGLPKEDLPLSSSV